MKKEGSIMANRNGMGPMNEGPLTGKGMGNCKSNGNTENIAKVGMAIGAGLGMAWGCRRRFRMKGQTMDQADSMMDDQRGMGRRNGLAGRGPGSRRRARR